VGVGRSKLGRFVQMLPALQVNSLDAVESEAEAVMHRQQRVRASLAAGILLAISGVAGVSQQGLPPRQQSPDPTKPLGEPNRNDDPFAGKLAEQQARSRNADRQKRLVADTDKLLSLATELKQDVDKTDKNTLSVDVVKRADEIEKLAHSVKERMKGGA